MNATIDFDAPGRTTSAATVWSTSAPAKPITDLLAQVPIRDAGGEPDIVMNSSVYVEMIATDQVKNLASSNGVNPSIVSEHLSAILTATRAAPGQGVLMARRVSGSSMKILADDKVAMYDQDGPSATHSPA